MKDEENSYFSAIAIWIIFDYYLSVVLPELESAFGEPFGGKSRVFRSCSRCSVGNSGKGSVPFERQF